MKSVYLGISTAQEVASDKKLVKDFALNKYHVFAIHPHIIAIPFKALPDKGDSETRAKEIYNSLS